MIVKSPKKVVIKDSRHVKMDGQEYEIRDGRFSVSKETPAVLTTTYTPILEINNYEDHPVANLAHKIFKVFSDGSRQLVREEFNPYSVISKRNYSQIAYGPKTVTHTTLQPEIKKITTENFPLTNN